MPLTTQFSPGKSLKDAANPSQLGDPVSLKAETSHTQPTEQDKPNQAPEQHKSLKQVAQEKNETNPSMLGDPVSASSRTDVGRRDVVGVG